MILQLGQEIQRLQAVDPQRLEKVVVRTQLLPRHLEVRRRKTKDFIKCLFSSLHKCTLSFLSKAKDLHLLGTRHSALTASTAAHPCSPQISATQPAPRHAQTTHRKYRSPAAILPAESA